VRGERRTYFLHRRKRGRPSPVGGERWRTCKEKNKDLSGEKGHKIISNWCRNGRDPRQKSVEKKGVVGPDGIGLMGVWQNNNTVGGGGNDLVV